MKETILLTCISLVLAGLYILFVTYFGNNLFVFFIAIVLIIIIFQLVWHYTDNKD